MTLSTQEVSLVCQLVDDLAGIQWDIDKAYLIESRLRSLLSEHGCADMTELVQRVRRGDEVVREAVLDAVTTRETLFFRDDAPFAALRHKALPEIIDARSRTSFPQRLRFWSAACSSGQEPYSLAITLCETIEDIDEWDVQILATDLSPAAIESASRGIYSDFEMSRGVPDTLRNKYFTKVNNGWKICDRIRSMVAFQLRNLLQPFDELGQFDVIFCRNVAIYFDLPTKTALFGRLAKVLANHGAIFVGGSETLSFMGDRWRPQHHCRGVYYQPHRVFNEVPARDHCPSRPAMATAIPASRSATVPPAAKHSLAAPSAVRPRPLVSGTPTGSVGATDSVILTKTGARTTALGLRNQVGQATPRPIGTPLVTAGRPLASGQRTGLGATATQTVAQAMPVRTASTSALSAARPTALVAPVGQLRSMSAPTFGASPKPFTASSALTTSKTTAGLRATTAVRPTSAALTKRPLVATSSRGLTGTTISSRSTPPKAPGAKTVGPSLVALRPPVRPGSVLTSTANRVSTTTAPVRAGLPTPPVQKPVLPVLTRGK